MMKVAFVILHYQNIDDTINCVDSIKELVKENDIDLKIIVVDNNSPNNSGEILLEKYSCDNMIEVLSMDKNYGFSIANNKGYQYAMSYNPDIISVINNDIIFEDKEFLVKLKKIYNSENKYDIVSPDIINLNNNHQNPLRDKPMTLRKAYKNMFFETFIFISMYIPVFRFFVNTVKTKREKKWFDNYYNTKNNINPFDFVPFGAFVIYMNDWIKKENKAFVSNTFMYEEEDMLSLYIKKKNYKIFYAEELLVRHLEGQSTKKNSKNEYNCIKFKSKNKAKALKAYIKYYKKINNER